MTSDPPEKPAFHPNAAEKGLGYIGAVTVAPLLVPFIPLCLLLTWANSAGGFRAAKRVLSPVAVALTAAAFVALCVLTLPYGLLLYALRRLGVVRDPPADELEQLESPDSSE